MAKVSVIVFREMLEISIFIGIISVATRSIINSRNYIILGIVIGSIISILVALIFAKISLMFDGLGAEFFSLAIIFIAIAMVAYTIIRVMNYNNELKRRFSDLQNGIQVGIKSKLAISLMVAATVVREGVEIVLFLGGIIATDKMVCITNYLIGGMMGGISAVLIGYGLYNGLIIIAPKYLFKVSLGVLIFIAAAMSSDAAAIMTSSGIIAGYSEVLWDSSWLVLDDSFFGRFLKVLIGYTATPNTLQVIFYISTLLGLYMLHYCCSMDNLNQFQKSGKNKKC
ncbi:FTR1 family protein [Orientia tsutsugamushi]|uniref:FTR1 family iron permease n=1 Tax=Orientia tsutsugamushi TaxID=784 RepID=UPI00315C824B